MSTNTNSDGMPVEQGVQPHADVAFAAAETNNLEKNVPVENPEKTHLDGHEVEAQLINAHAAGVLTSPSAGSAQAGLAFVDEPLKDEFKTELEAHAAAVPAQENFGLEGVDVKAEVAEHAPEHAAEDDETRAIGGSDSGSGASTGAVPSRRATKTRARKPVDFSSGGYFSDELSSEDMEFKEERGDDEYDPDADDEPQKKRGRPRLVDIAAAGSEPKRKRGRPRKIVVEGAEGSNPSTAKAAAAGGLGDDGEPKVKRKRGRPRKIRPEDEQDAANASGLASTIATNTTDGSSGVPSSSQNKPVGTEGGADEVDLGPIIMSNLTEANIDPNLDPSLYSNADASVYLLLGPSTNPLLNLSPMAPNNPGGSGGAVGPGGDAGAVKAVLEAIGINESEPLPDSQEQHLGKILDEALNAEFGLLEEQLQNSEQPKEPEQPVKRKRGRPRKGQEVNKSKPIIDLIEDLRRSSRATVTERKEREVQKRVARALRVQRKQEVKLQKQLGIYERKKRKSDMKRESENGVVLSDAESTGASDSDEESSAVTTSSDDSDDSAISDDDSEDEYRARKKYNVSPKKSEAAKPALKDKPPRVPKPPVQRRSKKGRPSKQENVTKEVFSIFKNEEGVSDSVGPTDPAETLGQLEEEKDKLISSNGNKSTISTKTAAIALNFDNKGSSTFSDIPIVSGIRDSVVTEQPQELERIAKFTPLPVPEIDEDGKIIDPTYAEKHLPGVLIREDDSATGRLIDERAFFLEGSEGYFEQHNLRFRPSDSSLSLNAPDLGFEEFAPYVELSLLVHRPERNMLKELHKGLYHQWCFELSQGYSLNFFGVGSKARMIMDFLEEYFVSWYHDVICESEDEQMPPVMIVNGYNPGTKLKAVLHDMTAAILSATGQPLRQPKHVSEAFPFLMGHLKQLASRNSKNRVVKASLVLVIHNIDGEAFRDERSQNLLSQLTALPNVWVIVSSDNVNLSLLWDLYRFKNYNFLWHDVTTYEPYAVEMSFKDVLSMGQSKKFVGSRGAKYVLASLTANAKKLYEVLLQLQMEAIEASVLSKTSRTGLKGLAKTSVELRKVYDRCVEKFIVSNEVNFKTMLGEYVEHKMCVLTKNTAGHEVVYVPFTLDEMTKLRKEEF